MIPGIGANLFKGVSGGNSGSIFILDVQNQPKISFDSGSSFATIPTSYYTPSGICCSLDGKYVFIAKQDGNSQYSINYGVSVSDITGVYYVNSGDISCSNDGQYILHVKANGKAYMSSDYGSNFAQVYSLPTSNVSWNGCAVSSTGQYMIAVISYTGIYVSSNYGSTWTYKSYTSSNRAPCMSADGQYQYFTEGSNIYRSSDYGSSWASVYSTPMYSFNSMDCSADGSILYLTATGSGIFKSTTYGSSPSIISANTNYYTQRRTISCSADGSIVLVSMGASSSYSYYSTNGGSSWTSLPYRGNNVFVNK